MVAAARPPAGTGPYSIVSYDPKRQLKLERNPHFHEWSPAARPDGYPDAIVMKFGVSKEAATTAVEQGRLDYAGVPVDRINEVTTRYAPQVHINTVSETNSLLINTRLAPFDSQDARRALSYALDRNEMIRLIRGPQLAQPTCQILPPNSPGYKPYCPFTLHPVRLGTWQASDLARARKLVARSHTRGTRVTVLTDEGENPKRIGGYLVQLLNRLGYVASRKVVPYAIVSRAPVFSGPRGTIQIYPIFWYADYPSAAAFIRGSFSCGGATNDAGFCDTRIDREMRQAQTLELTDPRAADAQWAHIDRELTDAAAWIPWSTDKEVDFVSKRVGNFQFHPLLAMLFDQLWVR